MNHRCDRSGIRSNDPRELPTNKLGQIMGEFLFSTQQRKGVGEFEVEETKEGRRVRLGGEDGTVD